MERSREIPDDVRRKFREGRKEETRKAERLVADAGGREGFDRERRGTVEKSREEVAEKEPDRRPDRRDQDRRSCSEKPPVAECPTGRMSVPIARDAVKDRTEPCPSLSCRSLPRFLAKMIDRLQKSSTLPEPLQAGAPNPPRPPRPPRRSRPSSGVTRVRREFPDVPRGVDTPRGANRSGAPGKPGRQEPRARR